MLSPHTPFSIQCFFVDELRSACLLNLAAARISGPLCSSCEACALLNSKPSRARTSFCGFFRSSVASFLFVVPSGVVNENYMTLVRWFLRRMAHGPLSLSSSGRQEILSSVFVTVVSHTGRCPGAGARSRQVLALCRFFFSRSLLSRRPIAVVVLDSLFLCMHLGFCRRVFRRVQEWLPGTLIEVVQ